MWFQCFIGKKSLLSGFRFFPVVHESYFWSNSRSAAFAVRTHAHSKIVLLMAVFWMKRTKWEKNRMEFSSVYKWYLNRGEWASGLVGIRWLGGSGESLCTFHPVAAIIFVWYVCASACHADIWHTKSKLFLICSARFSIQNFQCVLKHHKTPYGIADYGFDANANWDAISVLRRCHLENWMVSFRILLTHFYDDVILGWRPMMHAMKQ